MSRKLIFLDVDGTLVDFTMHMPESAREALSIARKRGHLISLCTGQTGNKKSPSDPGKGTEGLRRYHPN